MRSEFFNLSAEDFDLFTRKGTFPYEYIDCIGKLKKTELPSRELFYRYRMQERLRARHERTAAVLHPNTR